MNLANGRGDPTGGLKPIELGHGDVQDGDLRRFPLRGFDGLLPVGGLGDNLESGLAAQQGAEAASDQSVVVSDQDTDRAHCACRPAGVRGTSQEAL